MGGNTGENKKIEIENVIFYENNAELSNPSNQPMAIPNPMDQKVENVEIVE